MLEIIQAPCLYCSTTGLLNLCKPLCDQYVIKFLALCLLYMSRLFTSYSNEAYEVTVYDSDMMFLLCVWFFRMWVVQWPQEHARQRLGRVRAADSGGYFLTRTTSSPMTTRPSRSRLHARSLLPASCRYLFRPQADLTCL